MDLDKIEHAISCHEMNAAQVFTQMKQHIVTRGIKDHEISELINSIRDAVTPITSHQCLRELIHKAAIGYLESNGLRIDGT